MSLNTPKMDIAIVGGINTPKVEYDNIVIVEGDKWRPSKCKDCKFPLIRCTLSKKDRIDCSAHIKGAK